MPRWVVCEKCEKIITTTTLSLTPSDISKKRFYFIEKKSILITFNNFYHI